MSNDTYLRDVLRAQEVGPDSDEMKALQSARADIEALIRIDFEECSPTIRYGGSKAKGTMNLEDFDLDVITYFPKEDTAAGKTIKEIYQNVQDALSKKYSVAPKTTALRVKDHERDLKIDVVPGRFVDDAKEDAYVNQNGGSKDFLKTNLDTHIAHIRDSGFVAEDRLMKLWRPCAGIEVRTFPLELVVMKILKKSAPSGLSDRLIRVLSAIRDEIGTITIEDPANSNNDLSEALHTGVRQAMSLVASSSLQIFERDGWEGVFSRVANPKKSVRDDALRVSVRSSPVGTQPWRL